MNTELILGKNAQLVVRKKESPDVRGRFPQNITAVLPAFNKKVSIDSVALFTRHHADNIIVVDSNCSDLITKVAKLIFLIVQNILSIINGVSKNGVSKNGVSKESHISQSRCLCGSFGNKSGLLYNYLKLFLESLQARCKPCGNSRFRKTHSFLDFQTGNSFFVETGDINDKSNFGSRKNILLMLLRIRSPKFSFFDLVIS
jgi:hypothetical protein